MVSAVAQARGWRRRVVYACAPCGANGTKGRVLVAKRRRGWYLVRCRKLLRRINGYRKHNFHRCLVCPGVLRALSFLQARHLSVPRPGGRWTRRKCGALDWQRGRRNSSGSRRSLCGETPVVYRKSSWITGGEPRGLPVTYQVHTPEPQRGHRWCHSTPSSDARGDATDSPDARGDATDSPRHNGGGGSTAGGM